MIPRAIVHKDLPEHAKKALENEGFSVHTIPPCTNVDARISGHPDIQIFIFGHTVFVHPDISNDFVDLLAQDFDVIKCSERLSPKYTDDCRYNIAYTGKRVLCTQGSEPGKIRDTFADHKIIQIHIPQGYARCSILIVDEDSIITEDAGIHSTASSAGLNSLLVQQGHIPLKGFPRGFIGGATGRYGKTIFCTGKFPDHEDYLERYPGGYTCHFIRPDWKLPHREKRAAGAN